MKLRPGILIAAVAIAIAATFLFPAIPQSEAYHNFADKRVLLGIPNCFDVLSNAFFLIVGILGLRFVLQDPGGRPAPFLDGNERWPYFAFFIGVTLTAFGSGYYHLHPSDATLVWDRLPMAIGFMALVAAVLAERISVRVGVWLLGPLIFLGIGSVIYWSITQSHGHGDLRPYGLAQFGSLLVLALLLVLFPPRYTRGSDFVVSLAIYGVAKIFEAADKPIFAVGHIVSGHTLKHLAAALSAYWILRMLRLRVPSVRKADLATS